MLHFNILLIDVIDFSSRQLIIDILAVNAKY